jgi:hypothetical protein
MERGWSACRYGPPPAGLPALAGCGKTISAQQSSSIPVKYKTVKREVLVM